MNFNGMKVYSMTNGWEKESFAVGWMQHEAPDRLIWAK